MNKRLLWGFVVVVLVLAGAMFTVFREQPRLASSSVQLPLDSLLQNSTNFADPGQPWSYQFPADHGLHSDYRAEYWLFAGVLNSADGKTFGFQVALMRLALSAKAAESSPSAWASRQVYRAHLAIVDTETEQIYAFERYSRDALGLSGADSKPLRIWLDDWNVSYRESIFSIRAAEQGSGLGLQMQVTVAAAPVSDGSESTGLHGYLLPRLQVQGNISVENKLIVVSGDALLDHAWGRLPRAQGQMAFNRLLVQMDADDELRCLQLRRRDGSGTPITNCRWWDDERKTEHYGRRELTLDWTTEWQSPLDGTDYPVAWDLQIPARQTELAITPLIAGQELNFGLRLWAGLVRVSGQIAGVERNGYGYLELSGYAK